MITTLRDLVTLLDQHEENEREVAAARRNLAFGGSSSTMAAKKEVVAAAIRCREAHLDTPLFLKEDEL